MYIVGVMKKVIQTNRPDAETFLTVDEAATELGIKPTAIRNYLTWGYFTTYKFKTLTLLKKTELEEWRKNHQE